MMVGRIVMVAVLGFASVGAIQGQAGQASTVAATSPAKAVEDLIDKFEGEMTSAAKAMPAERYDFTPASLHIPGANFEKVRTFADEVKHVAQSNYLTAANISNSEPSVDVKAIGKLKSKDEIVAALAESFTAVHKAVAAITTANSNEAVDDIGVGPDTIKETEAAWIGVHGFDHYGQIVEYLRMNGIVPPPPATVSTGK